MKLLVSMAVLSVSLFGLAGCATTSEDTAAQYGSGQRTVTVIEDDEAYMAQVEAIARRRGIHLTWVNPPPRRVVVDRVVVDE